MKMNNKFIFSLILITILSSTFVLAQGLGPGVPHQFYGNATYNGAAAEGLSVDAYIEGIKVASTTASDGRYGYSPIFYVEDPDGLYEGKTIKFYLNDVDTGQTYNFINGESTKLDLVANGAPPTPPSGGGGGSSGGGSSTTTPKTTSTTGTGAATTSTTTTSTTTGTSGAGNETQPETTTGTEETEEQGFFSGITGAVTGVIGTPLGIGVLIFIIAIVAIYIYVNIMRKRVKAGK